MVVAAYVMVLRLLPWTWSSQQRLGTAHLPNALLSTDRGFDRAWTVTLLGASVALTYIAAAFVGSACGGVPAMTRQSSYRLSESSTHDSRTLASMTPSARVLT